MPDSFPPPLISSRIGSWAHSTVSQRFPEIARRTIAENPFPDPVKSQLLQLIEEIGQGRIRGLQDQGAPDQAAWQGYIQPYLGMGWLEVPWFFAEHYFYRRVMEAVDYFRQGEDPFGVQKRQGLESSRKDISTLADFLAGSLRSPRQKEETLREGLYFSLWGNQADLSLWPADSADAPKHRSQGILREHLLVDDLQLVVGRILGGNAPAPRIDIMLDNAGFELTADLGLADLCLGLGLAQSLVLHVKAHPTFVSDVIEPDVGETIAYLAGLQDRSSAAFGARLRKHLEEGRLQVRAGYFWNSPLPMWEVPDALLGEWAQSTLVISKGDANYRRILGDLQWDYTTPFRQVVDYLPVPLAALRTMKAELAAGLPEEKIRAAAERDPDWLIDGKWGVIQFAPPGAAAS